MFRANVHIDTSRANRMFHELSRKTGHEFSEVVTFETGRILEAALRNTKAASKGSIQKSFDHSEFSSQPASLYSPKTGRANVNVSNRGFITYYLKNRYPGVLWSRIDIRRRVSLFRKLAARGLAKNSWWQLAKELGVKINAPAYVKNAIPTTGRLYRDVSVRKSAAGAKFSITIENAQPTANLPSVGGPQALKRAIVGRVKFFERNLKNRVFESCAKTVRAYGGRVGK